MRRSLTAYLTKPTLMQLVPASSHRPWMDFHPSVNRCLPMRVANQAGWLVLGGQKVKAKWNGGDDAEDLMVEVGSRPVEATSCFGAGILTFYLPWVWRGATLLVRGPANLPKSVSPLEGIVEECSTTFTANWKFSEPGEVLFRPGEPIAQIVPLSLDFDYEPRQVPIDEDPEIAAEYRAWSSGRKRVHAEGHLENTYYRGDHVRDLGLRSFDG